MGAPLVIERVFNASIDRLWGALTETESMKE